MSGAPAAAASTMAMIVSRVRMVLHDGRSSARDQLRQGEVSGTANGPGRSGVSPSVHDSLAFLWWRVLRLWGLSTLLCRC